MNNSFQLKPLSEIIDFKNGKAIKTSNGNIPIYGGNGILGYTNDSNYVNNLIIGRVGAYCGSVHLSIGKCWVSDNAIAGEAKENTNLLFAYYLLKSLNLNQKQVGSSQPLLTQGILNHIYVHIPEDKTTQQKIASVLSTLDEKIALNNQINATLEQMAKTLYDYWFVQFDFPDDNGKPYKSSGGEMVYNETLKRDIPKGWEVKDLGSIAHLYQPQTLSESDLLGDGKYLVYGANGIIGRYDKFNHEKPMVTITCRGNTCGNINITMPFSWITGNAMVVNPKNEVYGIDYLNNLLSHSKLSNTITGSAQPQITRTNLAPLTIIDPVIDIIEKYNNTTKYFFSMKVGNLQENIELTKLRDWLLPMLMNGQVTVQ